MVQPVPVYNESAGYKEWECEIDSVRYCIIREGTQWTLLRTVVVRPGTHSWEVTDDDVTDFLAQHTLMLCE